MNTFLKFCGLWNILYVKKMRFFCLFVFYIKKKPFVTLNLKCIPLWKHIFWTNQQNFVRKSWSYRKNIFHKREINNKNSAEKSFSVFGGAHGRPLNTIKLYLAKCFSFLSHAYEKYICHHFKIFFSQNLADIT